MLTTPHAVTGAAIATLVPNPVVAIPLAILSHYALDTVPHWQETLAPYTPTTKTWIRIPIDIALSLTLVYLIARHHPAQIGVIWASAIAANVPDLDSLLVLTPALLQKGIIKKYWDWHCNIQNETSSWFGVVTQLIVISLGLLIS